MKRQVVLLLEEPSLTAYLQAENEEKDEWETKGEFEIAIMSDGEALDVIEGFLQDGRIPPSITPEQEVCGGEIGRRGIFCNLPKGHSGDCYIKRKD